MAMALDSNLIDLHSALILLMRGVCNIPAIYDGLPSLPEPGAVNSRQNHER